jgi:signal transduction histidine kinase
MQEVPPKLPKRKDEPVSPNRASTEWSLSRWFSGEDLERDYARIRRSGLTLERSARIGGMQFLIGGIGMAVVYLFVHPDGPLRDGGWPIAYAACAAIIALGIWELRVEDITPGTHLAAVYATLFAVTLGTWLTDGRIPLVILLVVSAQHWAVHPPRRMIPVVGLAVLCALSPLLYTDTSAGQVPYELILAPTLLIVIASLIYMMAGIYRDERALRAETEAANEAAEAATAAAARLAEIDEMKDGFVSTVSHELRTPLTSIKGYLEALLEGEGGGLTPDQEEFCRIAFRNADRLHALIGDLLTVSRIDSGMLNLKPERIEVGDVVNQVAQELAYVRRSQKIEIEVEIEDGLEVKADRRRIEQAVTNLLSNAIKYSPEGSTIVARTHCRDGKIVIEVADHGVGIPDEEVGRIGERFFRASTAGTTQGTGLGLAITQRLIELQGGSLEVESELGAGSTFRIVLPQAPRSLVKQRA